MTDCLPKGLAFCSMAIAALGHRVLTHARSSPSVMSLIFFLCQSLVRLETQGLTALSLEGKRSGWGRGDQIDGKFLKYHPEPQIDSVRWT